MSKKNLNVAIVKKARAGYIGAMALLMATATVTGAATPIFDAVTNTIVAQAATPSVVYQAHVSTVGWQGDVRDGILAGTVGRSLAIECVTLEVKGMSGGIKYRVHMANKGWSDWVYDDRPCGTTGENRQLEAIEIQLYGDIAKNYDVEYRTHCQNVGWTKWIKSGVSGTTGQSLRMEGFQVRLVKKANTASATSTSQSAMNFAALKSKYPSGSTWTGSYMNKAWQCHGFALTLGKALSNKDPYGWNKVYNLNSLKPGDIVRFNRPHTIMVTAVNGDTITYVDCNWVGKNKVQWDQTISRSQMTKKFGSLSYVMVYPK